MSTQAHTPGPWVYDIRKAELIAPEVTALGIKTGAAIWGPHYGPSPADGQLCAAAPDMLAALKECSDDLEAMVEHHYTNTKDHPAMTPKYERDMQPVKTARAIIAKAEGRS